MNGSQVVIVDREDREIGRADVSDAHLCPGILHRAISVVLYRMTQNGPVLLITKRSDKKSRWPGFWTNPVCTHPKPGESYPDACVRRLKEELGIRVKKSGLFFLFRFQYEASYDGTLCENELDSVYIAERKGRLYPDESEISQYSWLPFDEVKQDILDQPDTYTPWFRMILQRHELSDFLASL